MSNPALGDIATQAQQAIFSGVDLSILDRYFAESLIQHDPNIADGLGGLKDFAMELRRSPALSSTTLRTLVDGQHVLLHSKHSGMPGEHATMIAFDLFRFEGAKIVEHWGGQEPEMPLNVSGRSQVDGAVALTDLGRTEANRALVRDFKQVVTVELRFDRIDDYIDDHNYAQHASKVGDGTARLKARIAEATQPGAGHSGLLLPCRYVAEGNFVLALVDAQGASGHTANYDLFRVENGKLVEHWDVLSPIPARAQWKNDNGPF